MNLRGSKRDAQAILGFCGSFVARDATNRPEPLWLRVFVARIGTKQSAFYHICETVDLLDAEPLKYQLSSGA